MTARRLTRDEWEYANRNNPKANLMLYCRFGHNVGDTLNFDLHLIMDCPKCGNMEFFYSWEVDH